jgi:drug/metabolite transporter (DMT)-like permease
MWIARVMAGATVLLWSASFLWSKTLLGWLDPLAAAGARFMIAAVVLLLIALPKGGAFAALRANWRGYLVLGLIGITALQLLLFFALDYTTAVNFAVIMALTPALTMVGAALFLGEPFDWRACVGMAIAVAGALLAVLGDSPAGLAGLTLDRGEPLALLAAGCLAFYTVASRRLLPSDISPITNTALVIATGAIFLLPLSFAGEATRGEPTVQGLAALAGLSLGATVLGYLFWNRAVSTLGVGEPSLLYNFIPVLTMLMVSLQGTPPHAEQVVGGLLVIAGVSLAATHGKLADAAARHG